MRSFGIESMLSLLGVAMQQKLPQDTDLILVSLIFSSQMVIFMHGDMSVKLVQIRCLFFLNANVSFFPSTYKMLLSTFMVLLLLN